MKILKGEIIQNDTVIKSAKKQYGDTKDFFIALVTISDNLNIDVPIWTMKEDRSLEKNNETLMALEGNRILRIYTEKIKI